MKIMVLDDAGPTEAYVEIPKGNDRMFAVTVINRGRARAGTATLYRWLATLSAIKRRHPRAVQSPRGRRGPIIIRTRKGGPAIATCEPLPGPVRSAATVQ